jgi:pilus assembly protein Flp/PilA
MKNFLKTFIKDESGASAAEYALIIAVVGVGIGAAALLLGANVKQAVNDLRTTTPENWWNRHEQAMRRTADDVEADVAKLAGHVKPVAPKTTEEAHGETVSTAPFTSQRDEFVASMRARVDAMKQALDNVKASGPKQTEVDDVRARINKLSDDIDRLKSASPDDWWDVSKARVTEYVDRIDRSLNRLDDRG